MNAELVKMMDREEVLALAEALGVEVVDWSYEELCQAVARALNKD